jgi:hypothetical protein
VELNFFSNFFIKNSRHTSSTTPKVKVNFSFNRVKDIFKDIFGARELKTLFFGTSISIFIVNSTWVLKKERYGTSDYFSVQNLTYCHVSTLGC